MFGAESGVGWGYFQIHRKIQDHWLWKDKPYSKGQAWIDMILLANHKDKKTTYGNQVIKVKRGEFVRTERDLANRWGWSQPTTHRFLKVLKNESMIDKKVNQSTNHITICNYEGYQNPKNDDESNVNQERIKRESRKENPLSGPQLKDLVSKECKEVNKKEKNSAERKIPASFTSDEIKKLRETYGEEYQEKIDEVFEGWKSCRSTYKIAESVILRELQYWNKFKDYFVKGAIDTYIEKEFWKDGSKSENYFRGVLRNEEKRWEKIQED